MAGLRERKKARTRAAIQQHALRLFREHGYEATTVSQIAAAAEVSESTFFRYFPTKEELAWWDDLDPEILALLRAQPAGTDPVRALRTALQDVLGRQPPEVHAALHDRVRLVLSAAPLRGALLDQLRGSLRMIAEAVAERAGRPADDAGARALAAALVGVGLSAMFAVADDRDVDLVVLLDTMLAQLEGAFPDLR